MTTIELIKNTPTDLLKIINEYNKYKIKLNEICDKTINKLKHLSTSNSEDFICILIYFIKKFKNFYITNIKNKKFEPTIRSIFNIFIRKVPYILKELKSRGYLTFNNNHFHIFFGKNSLERIIDYCESCLNYNIDSIIFYEILNFLLQLIINGCIENFCFFSLDICDF